MLLVRGPQFEEQRGWWGLLDVRGRECGWQNDESTAAPTRQLWEQLQSMSQGLYRDVGAPLPHQPPSPQKHLLLQYFTPPKALLRAWPRVNALDVFLR